jgi:hypothetical protein
VIRFRPLEESDLPQIEAWLRTECVAEWWRDPLEIAVEKRQAAVEGRRDVDLFVGDPAASAAGSGPRSCRSLRVRSSSHVRRRPRS